MHHLLDQETMSPLSKQWAEAEGQRRQTLWGADRFNEGNSHLWAPTMEVDGLVDRVAGIFTESAIDPSEHDAKFLYSKQHPALSLGLDEGESGAVAWVFDFNSRVMGRIWDRRIRSETFEARANLPPGTARLWAEVIPVGGSCKGFDPQYVKALTRDLTVVHLAINAAMTSGGVANGTAIPVDRRVRPPVQ